MVICRYFQQGYCRFGSNCRFEHPDGGHDAGQQYDYRSQYSGSDGRYNQRSAHGKDGRYGYNDNYRGDSRRDYQSNYRIDNRAVQNRIGNHNNYDQYSDGSSYRDHRGTSDQHNVGGYRQGQNRKDETQELTNAEIMEIISEDMELWESGKMWLFSCYGYHRELKSFPGLEDWSFEEVRLAAYEANATGKSTAYLDWIAQLVKEYRAKRAELRSPDALTRSSLLNVIEEIKRSSSQNSVTSTFTGNADAFGSNPNTFTGSANTFGSNPNTFTGSADAFGSNPNTFTGSANAFGSNPSTFTGNANAFMGTANTFPGIGASSNTPSGGNVFSGSGTPVTSSVPGSSAFGTVVQRFPFAASTPVTSSVFPAQSAFDASATPQSAFGMSGTQVNSPASFTGFSGSSASGTAQTFGNNQNVANQQPPSSGQWHSELYTPMALLTSEEKKEFENAKFTFGCVPQRPPPMELT